MSFLQCIYFHIFHLDNCDKLFPHYQQAAVGVSASYDALFDLFECVGNFLGRLHIYTEKIPLVPTMSDLLVKIMTEVLGVLAVATKQIRQGRFSM